MNRADYRGAVVVIVDVITTAVNLSIMVKMSKKSKNNCRLNGKYSRFSEILMKTLIPQLCWGE